MGHFLPQDEAFLHENVPFNSVPWETSAIAAAASMKNEQKGIL